MTTTTSSTPPPSPGPRPDHVALAWHDVTCPEGDQCRSRTLHAASATPVTSGLLHRFLTALDATDPHRT